MRPGFDTGAVLLLDAKDKAYRLSWESGMAERKPDETKPDDPSRVRALPPGDYRMVGYRLMRKAASGETWWASATGQPIRRLALRAGETAVLEIDPTVHVRGRSSRTSVNVDVKGEGKSGLSLYREGKRIDLRFRLLDAEGKERTAGTIHYG